MNEIITDRPDFNCPQIKSALAAELDRPIREIERTLSWAKKRFMRRKQAEQLLRERYDAATRRIGIRPRIEE